MAMALFHQGQTEEACQELAQSRQWVEGKFKTPLDHGRAGAGFWFDWIYARRLLQEASDLINCDGQPAAGE